MPSRPEYRLLANLNASAYSTFFGPISVKGLLCVERPGIVKATLAGGTLHEKCPSYLPAASSGGGNDHGLEASA